MTFDYPLSLVERLESANPEEAFRRGELAVVPRRNGTLPPYCVSCGASAETSERRTFTWLPAWILVPLAILVVVPACFIVAVVPALLLTRRARVDLPVCDAHRGAYGRWLLRTVGLATLGPALAAVGLFAGGATRGPAVVLGGGLFLASLVAAWRGRRHVWARKIERRAVILVNVAPAVLDRLPSEGPHG